MKGCWVALCLCSASAFAADLPRYGVFVYSSFCVSALSDDVGGNRVTWRRAADGDLLVYEYTDGSTHALIARALTIDPKSHAVRFDVSVEGEPTSTIAGYFSADGQKLILRGFPFQGGSPETLVRVTNLAAPIKTCVPRAADQ